MRKQRLAYPKDIILGHLNVYLLWNWLYSISEMIKWKFDAFLINLSRSILSKQWICYVCYEFISKDRNIKTRKRFLYYENAFYIKGTLMQIWKSANIVVFIWKWYVEDFTLKHHLLFEICAREICEMFVYKHSETTEYVKN